MIRLDFADRSFLAKTSVIAVLFSLLLISGNTEPATPENDKETPSLKITLTKVKLKDDQTTETESETNAGSYTVPLKSEPDEGGFLVDKQTNRIALKLEPNEFYRFKFENLADKQINLLPIISGAKDANSQIIPLENEFLSPGGSSTSRAMFRSSASEQTLIVYVNKSSFAESFEEITGVGKTRSGVNIEAVTNLGVVYGGGFGLTETSIQFYKDAIALFDNQDHINLYGRRLDRKESIILYNNAGLAYYSVGKYREAKEYYDKAIFFLERFSDRTLKATVYNNLGLLYASANQPEKAISIYQEALDIWNKESRMKSKEANTRSNLGSVYSLNERFEEAIREFEKALNIQKNFDDKAGQGITLNNLAYVYRQQNNLKKAIEYSEESIKLSDESGNIRGKASPLNNLGVIYFKSKDYKNAAKYFLEALPINRQVRNRVGEAVNLTNLMNVNSALGHKSLASIQGKQAVGIFQQIREDINSLDSGAGKRYLESVKKAYRELADLLIERGRFAQAEQVLRLLKEEELSEFTRRTPEEIKGIKLLNKREEELINRYSVLAGEVTEIGQKFLALNQKKRKLSDDNSDLSGEEQKLYNQLKKQVADANAAFKLFLERELQEELGSDETEKVEVHRSLQNKLRDLGEGTVALYTIVTQDRYRVILTTPVIQVDGKTEFESSEMKGQNFRSVLNKKIFDFRRALQNPEIDPRPLGKELYDILIKPIEKDLKKAKAKTLVWSLDGTLRYIPLAALSPDGKKYLVEDYQNVLITPKTLDDISDSDADWRVLGMGVSEAQKVTDPDDDKQTIDFLKLKGTEEELEAIVSDEEKQDEKGVLFGRRFMDGEFTVKNLENFLIKRREENETKKKYNVVHIASHFRLGNDHFNSFLLLGNGKILTLQEIDTSPDMNFGGVELVTLSACNTGFSDSEKDSRTAVSRNGKEIDSLAGVITKRGGKAVLATLWAVADKSTSVLMSEFYRFRKDNPKLTKAKAMQMAQTKLMQGNYKTLEEALKVRSDFFDVETGETLNQPKFKKDPQAPFAHPFYWSPFILIGNWK